MYSGRRAKVCEHEVFGVTFISVTTLTSFVHEVVCQPVGVQFYLMYSFTLYNFELMSLQRFFMYVFHIYVFVLCTYESSVNHSIKSVVCETFSCALLFCFVALCVVAMLEQHFVHASVLLLFNSQLFTDVCFRLYIYWEFPAQTTQQDQSWS